MVSVEGLVASASVALLGLAASEEQLVVSVRAEELVLDSRADLRVVRLELALERSALLVA